MMTPSLGRLLGSVAPTIAMATALVMLIGCGDGRLRRSPVSGRVMVDGKPAGGAIVVLHPVAGSVGPEAEKIRPTGTCDRDGKFVLGTWELADGVPAGRWKATVQWFTAAGAADGADPETAHAETDRLGGAYGDPEATSLTVEVLGAPLELPAFELRTAAPR
jgi:hypothetical protein